MNAANINQARWPATIGACLAWVFTAPALPATAEVAVAEPAIAKTANDASLQWGGCPDFLPPGCAIAVLHGDPAQPNVDIFFRVPAKAEIAPHSHTSAERMVLVSGEMRVSYEGQAPVTLTPGTYAYGPAGKPHSASCVSDVACILFIAFESPLDAIPLGVAGR
jgi:quercetin dioxygenase-like cupin family protein